MIVAFEGLDRAGKSTLRRTFAKAVKEKHLSIDRFTTTSWVFNRWFNRFDGGQVASLLAFEKALIPEHLVVVFVDTPVEICRERGAEYRKSQLLLQRFMFLDELERVTRLGGKVIVVDGRLPIDELTEDTVKKVEALQ